MYMYDASRVQHAIIPSFNKRLAFIVTVAVVDHATVTETFPFSSAKDVLSYQNRLIRNNNNLHLLCAHQRPERLHGTY